MTEGSTTVTGQLRISAPFLGDLSKLAKVHGGYPIPLCSKELDREKLAEQQANFKQDKVDISLEARALGAGGGGGRIPPVNLVYGRP